MPKPPFDPRVLAIQDALLNIIGTLAVLKFFRYGDLSHPGGEEPGDS